MARKRTVRKLARTPAKRRWQKPRPMRIAALIVSAIQDLRETKGLTPRKIMGYISYASNMPEGQVKRQVKAALRRGVEYGILKKYRGHYFLPAGDEIDRANRIAVRFARLPSPQRTSAARNHRRMIVARDRKKVRGVDNKSENSVVESKRPRKSRSLPFSTTTTATRSFVERPEDDDVSAE